jgi:alkylation response protein AidB-like acyl-CoA dehydrogenase
MPLIPVPESLGYAVDLVTDLVGDSAAEWDLAGLLPVELLRTLGGKGLLCAEVPAAYGGLGVDSRTGGEFTAHVGSLCSSLRSILTSQGMAAWTISRLGSAVQRRDYLSRLTSGQLAAVAFSEVEAGSDLSAMATRIEQDGDFVTVRGDKVWTTAAAYADLIVVVGRFGSSAAAVVVPADAPGVTVTAVPHPSGCRAAGHADVRLDDVRLPADAVLGGGGQPLALLITTALAAGRMSVAWGCVGILRACLAAASGHAANRRQFGKPLADHQLVARRLADLFAAEQVAIRVCEHASRCWDSGSPDMVTATVLAKLVSSTQAVQGSAAAVQVLGSAAANDGHVVARAYRDAKLMELIEGSTEICQLMLAQHAIATAR